ncbi:isoamylase early set domain-containing protein [Colwellia echini]|uniref:1,4-alpha-glucan branching protein n=1 Tax=Colwellia echini TaxID=1982103 RepID=A0ABY3MWH0_9GAMM|nr:isoamylase early set domain-containing protein [Colwellia echini]TYK65454.1 1,4-alpha-glucan branching protein [Colwellia echini]
MISKRTFKTKDETEVTFIFSRDDVKKVELVADFNQWQPSSMKFDRKNNRFTAKVRLPNDNIFHFKYLLDGKEWENDYAADHYLPNVFGSENSVVSTVTVNLAKS